MKEVIDFLEKLPEEKWATKVNSTWNIKDVVAHLIAWNYEAAKEIERVYAEGGEPWFMGAENVDDFNLEAVEKYSHLSKKELILELKLSDKEVDMAIEKIGPENLENRPGFKWLFDKKDRKPHSIKHLEQIKKVLKENE